ncbi:MAG TPA: hypothetical protein VHC44_12295 [Verrucomicrobiae bacterium]|nr:hypothetical protein [Verrucomicrobiae bacterium]
MNRENLNYLLTGSMASNFWGIPRTTHDLDFVIQLPPSSVPKLVQAFRGDFVLDEAAIRSAYQPPHQFNAIDTRSPLKVDFWLLRPMPFEREMFARRKQKTLFGEPAWIATAEDVLLHKLYWNKITASTRQLGDAAGIAIVQKDALDVSYLRLWAKEIDVLPILEDVLSGKVKLKET